jgi:hypothetical protein
MYKGLRIPKLSQLPANPAGTGNCIIKYHIVGNQINRTLPYCERGFTGLASPRKSKSATRPVKSLITTAIISERRGVQIHCGLRLYHWRRAQADGIGSDES